MVDSSTSETSDLVGTDGSSADLGVADTDAPDDKDSENTVDADPQSDLEDADANSPDAVTPNFEEILGDPLSPTSCGATCTAEGLSCTGEYQNLLGASVAGEALYIDGWRAPLTECDQIPRLLGGGGQMSPLDQVICYCSQP